MSSPSLQSLFAEAIELAPSQQLDFVAAVAKADQALAHTLGAMLEADQRFAHYTAVSVIPSVAELVPKLSDWHGRRIGSFRITGLLGRGGMGSVWRAERIDGVEQVVAIKLMQSIGPTQNADGLRRFQLERQTLANLNHPNIAALIDANQMEDGTPYFVMELIEGKSITEYSKSKALSLKERISMFISVCEAVQHAHQKLVVHRDLKPQNILVDGAGRVKLLDFGVAKTLAPTLESTSPELAFFTANYAAPEQILGQSIGIACDVYALGLLLFELLTDQLAFHFDGLSAGQIEHQIVQIPAPAPSSRTHDRRATLLRGDLDVICLKCLKKSPTERYSSVQSLVDDLHRYLTNRPILARADHSWYVLRKFLSRHRLSVKIAAVSAMALLGSFVALFQQVGELRTERDRSRESLALLQDAFGQADPIRVSGAETNARQILQRVSQRVITLQIENPGKYIDLSTTLAEVNLSLGLADHVIELCDQALTMDELPLANRAHFLVKKSQALMILHQYGEARLALHAVAQQFQTQLAWQSTHARWLALNGSAVVAIVRLRALMEQHKTLPATNPDAVALRFYLAEAQRKANQPKAESTTWDETLGWLRAQLPADHPQIIRARMRRVVALRVNSQFELSLEEALSVAGSIARIYGSNSLESASAQNALGRTLDSMGKEIDAIAAYKNAVAAFGRAGGEDHPDTLRAKFNLAYSLQLTDPHSSEVRAIYLELIKASDRRLGADDDASVYYRLFFAKFLASIQQQREAAKVILNREAIPGYRRMTAENLDTLDKLLQHLQLKSDPDISVLLKKLQQQLQ